MKELFMTYLVRHLEPSDYEAWLPLWQGYLTFYKTKLTDEVTATTWQRFHDANEPMRALGAFDGEKLMGITHYIFHRSCWSVGPNCYLQDLFTTPEARGRGVGRALIEAVYAAAALEGSPKVYWMTHETNAEAMVLYNKVAERSGFLQYRKAIG